MFQRQSTIVERLHMAGPALYAKILAKEKTAQELLASDHRGNTALHEAAALGNVQLATDLLTLGCLVNAKNDDLETPLIRAAKYAEDGKSISEMTKTLLEAGANAMAQDKDERRAVSYCLEKEDLESVKLLRDFSFFTDGGGAESCQMLLFEMALDNELYLLKQKGLDTRASVLFYLDEYGHNLLQYSVTAGNVGLTRNFLACGYDVNAVTYSGLSPLIYAAQSRRRKWKSVVIKLLLEAGADVTATDSSGYTALHLCAQYTRGDTKSVGLLLEAGIDVNSQQKLSRMRTPLLVASQRGDIEVMLLLLQRGADPSLCSTDGEYPLNSAVAALYSTAPAHRIEALVYRNILQLLMTCGADPNLLTRDYEHNNSFSAFMHILTVGDVRQVQLFLDNGADPRLVDDNGQAGLHYAARNPDYDVLELLLDFFGADSAKEIRGKCKLGLTALHIAVKQKHLDNVQMLCEYGADVNAVANNGDTPLLDLLSHKSNGLRHLADLLLWYGADPAAKSATGKSAYQLALRFNSLKFTQLIFRYALLKVVRHRYGAALASHEELKNQDAKTLQALTKERRVPHSYFVACAQELNRMQASALHHDVSYLDILACSYRQLLSYARNAELVSAFKSYSNSVKMPFFGDIIKKRFHEAVTEMKTLIVAKEVLKELLPVYMCDLVVEQILSYLNERELKKVVQDRMILLENYVFNPINGYGFEYVERRIIHCVNIK